MHPSDETLLEWIHGELEGDGAAVVESHVVGCDACRAEAERLRAREGRLFQLFGALDEPAPPVSPQELLGRRRRRSVRAGWAVAAGVAGLIAVTGTAAVVSPGFRSLVVDTFARTGAADPGQSVPGESPGGIEIPAPERLEVVLPANPELGALELRLGSEPVVRLEASAGEVRFDVREASVVVADPPAGADFVLTVPEGLSALSVRVGEREVLRKSGDAILPTPDPSGRSVVQLSGRTPPP